MTRFFKVIACEIALREICHAAAQSRNMVDLEFLPQGLHDTPAKGREEVQKCINAVPAGRYDAILVGYGLCGNIVTNLVTPHTPLVIPRAHDCITFFLGSRERYDRLSAANTGVYYYTSGWLECLRRRGEKTGASGATNHLPTRAGMLATNSVYDQWVTRYGEERAKYLLEVMDQWTANYTHGTLIDFDFTRVLHLREQVEAICGQNGWQYDELEGDLRLIQHWIDGEWDPTEYLVVKPGEKVVPSYQDSVIATEAVDS